MPLPDAPVLSICIATHHGRSQMLGEAIQSVTSQVPAVAARDLEICISDNASQDGTERLVSRLAALSPVTVTYSRVERDRGGPANVLRAVTLARGRWCWLLGSDDAIAPGAITDVLEMLSTDPRVSGATVNRAAYDAELSEPLPQEPHPWIVPAPGEHAQEFLGGTVEVFERLGLLLSFQSAQIARRDLWAAAIETLGERRVVRAGTMPHVLIIAAMLASPASTGWIWCEKPLVRQRTGTAELGGAGGSLARFMVDISRDIARVLSSIPELPEPMRRELLERWRREVGAPAVIEAIHSHPSHRRRDNLQLLVGYGRVFGRLPGYWRETAPAIIVTAAGPR